MISPIKSRVHHLTSRPFKIVAAPRPDATLADVRQAMQARQPVMGRGRADGTPNPDRPTAPRAG